MRTSEIASSSFLGRLACSGGPGVGDTSFDEFEGDNDEDVSDC